MFLASEIYRDSNERSLTWQFNSNTARFSVKDLFLIRISAMTFDHGTLKTGPILLEFVKQTRILLLVSLSYSESFVNMLIRDGFDCINN